MFTIMLLLHLGFLAGFIIVIIKLARGASLWLISAFFLMPLVLLLLNVSIYVLFVLSEYTKGLAWIEVLLCCWYLPKKKTWRFWLRLWYGPPRGGIYSPLDTTRNQIRLLVIAPGQQTDEVSCSLLTVVLYPSAPEFEALSYTWGPDYSFCYILLYDSPFAVTPNLFGALKRLRLRDEPRVMWIDALFIDQSNIGERGEQVVLMREIYSSAAKISLGLERNHLTAISPCNSCLLQAWRTLLKNGSLEDYRAGFT